MQITINTDTDDLPAVIRMLQAYGGYQGTMALVADVKELSKKVEATAAAIIKSGPNHLIEGGGSSGGLSTAFLGVPPDQLYKGEALAAALPPCSAHADEPDEEPTPEQVFAAPKSLFDSAQEALAPYGVTVKTAEVRPGPIDLSDVTVDAAGLPWDARIHSGAKSKLANGNWKLLRGVDPALVASVEAELRGAPKPAPSAAEPATSTGAPPVPVAPPVSPPPPPAPIAATPYAPPPVPPAPKPITNAAELVAAVMDKRFTTDQVNAACRAVGIDNVASLLAKQDKLPEVLKELGI